MSYRQSQYLGSEAFNQSLQINEYVNKNTGALTVAAPLVTLRGVSSALNLDVVLGHRPGATGVFGLPDGWDLGIPYIFNDQSLTTRGKTYVIDPQWESAGGVRSGLRYVNVKGVQFTAKRSTQRTPSGKAAYAASCRYADGVTDYFDGTGRLVERVDLFGSAIAYAYSTPLDDALGSRLATITDSFGQTVRFDYGTSTITVTLPDGTTRVIALKDGAVASVTGPLDTIIRFGQTRAAGVPVVSSISYPTGLVTALTYSALGYRAPDGSDAAFPAVETLVRRGPDQAILSSSRFRYGARTGGNTFTGLAAGVRLLAGGDALMDSGKSSYLYDTIEEKLDAQGATLSVVGSTFNFLHSPVLIQDLTRSDAGEYTPVKSTSYEYPDLTRTGARTAGYFLPIRTQETETAARLRQPVITAAATNAYDAHGNVTVSVQLLGHAAPTPISERRHTYVETDDGRSMPETTRLIDHVTGAERQLNFTLTQDQRAIAAVTVLSRPDPGADWTPFKTKRYEYDAQGRETAWTLAWADGYAGDQGNLTAVRGATAHAFDAQTGRVTVTETDPLGNASVFVFDARRPSAPVLSTRSPGGATASFTHDDLGRCVQWTDPLERTTSTVFTLASGTGKANVATTTGPTGYTTRLTHDAMGRLVMVEDNGDPTATGTGVSRTLRRAQYDARGLATAVTDELGLTTTVGYDALARPITSTDPAGNVTTTEYDDAQLTAVQSLNGDVRNILTANGLGEILTVETLPDSGDAGTRYRIRQANAYDGFGQLVSETVASADAVTGISTRLSRVELRYDADGGVVGVRYTGSASTGAAPGRDVTVTASVTRDLLGNPVVEERSVTYGSGQPLRSCSEVRTYDAAGNLVAVTNQLGQTETTTFDADGRPIAVKRYDGSLITMTYYADGSLQSRTAGGVKTTFVYTADGLIEQVSEGDATISYAYAPGGSVKSVKYPDGTGFTWEQDKFGRIIKQTDPIGGVATSTFDQLGRFTRRTQGPVTVAFTYGAANHDRSALVGLKFTGPSTRAWGLEYDGFGDVRRVGVTDKAGKSILSAAYARDADRNLIQTVVSSALSTSNAVNNTSRFTYDGLGQLIGRDRDYAFSETDEALAYEYDGAANVVASTVDGATTRYTYDAANQMTGEGISRDELGRLTADGLGNVFRYDDADRLIAVETLGGSRLTATYHPSGLLAQVEQDGEVTTFHYRGGYAQTVTTTTSDGETTPMSRMSVAGGEVAAVAADGSVEYVSCVHRSTGLIDDGSQPVVALEYDPYGAVVGDRLVGMDLAFLWNQEFRATVAELVYLRGRWYHPGLRQFLVEDPRLTANRHGYSANPVDDADPIGEAFFFLGLALAGVGTLIVGGIVGYMSATRVGADHFFASVGVGTVATTVGAVMGEAAVTLAMGGTLTLAGLGPIALAGALAGVIGSGVGGILGRGAMRFTLGQIQSQRLITAVGTLCSLGGGLTGALVAGGVMTLAVGVPFFSGATAIAMTAGLIGGLGGALHCSGAYLGLLSSNIIPVPLTEAEVDDDRLVRRAHRNGRVGKRNARRLLVMAYQSEADSTGNIIASSNSLNLQNPYLQALYLPRGRDWFQGLLYGNGPYDTIAAHGCGRTIFMSVVYAGSGNATPTHMRPAHIDLFVRYVKRRGTFSNTQRGGVKFLSCFANFGNAQTLANALQRTVWAGRGVVSSTANFVWDRYDPL